MDSIFKIASGNRSNQVSQTTSIVKLPALLLPDVVSESGESRTGLIPSQPAASLKVALQLPTTVHFRRFD